MRGVIFILFSPNDQRAGGGGGGAEGCAARLFLFSFFPCSADHERDWPPGKVVFLGLATNAITCPLLIIIIIIIILLAQT